MIHTDQFCFAMAFFIFCLCYSDVRGQVMESLIATNMLKVTLKQRHSEEG
jgi:hypothetical protein